MRQLADRHYSRRTPGARQFTYAARKLILRDTAGEVLWAWLWPQPELRMDGQEGYNCAIFRNESARRSSEIILEAEQHAIRYWGLRRMFTYVGRPGRDIRSTNPGFCYLQAGWHKHGYSRHGLRLLVKYDECDGGPR
jgi:hypothetical protein